MALTPQVTSQRCSAFTWRSTLGENPLATHSGKVVLVALMKGYCSYCITQASRLDALKSRLASEGYPDIAMVIVNGGESISRNSIANLQQASSIPVIQDNEQHTMYQEIFRRNKDDFIVYDRCGQRSVVIPHPYSFLGHVITERVLKTVHSGRHSCHCQLDTIAENGEQIQSDEPLGPRDATQTSTYVNIQCPQGDNTCQRFERRLNRNRLDDDSEAGRPHRRRGRGRGRGRNSGRGHGHGRGRQHSMNNGEGARQDALVEASV
nr:selenoprotein P-like [Biomphalaria glabrata]